MSGKTFLLAVLALACAQRAVSTIGLLDSALQAQAQLDSSILGSVSGQGSSSSGQSSQTSLIGYGQGSSVVPTTPSTPTVPTPVVPTTPSTPMVPTPVVPTTPSTPSTPGALHFPAGCVSLLRTTGSWRPACSDMLVSWAHNLLDYMLYDIFLGLVASSACTSDRLQLVARNVMQTRSGRPGSVSL